MVNFTSRSISLVWVEPAEINGVLAGYQITISPGSGGVNSSVVPGNVTSFDADMLTPFTLYQLEVAAITGAGVGQVEVASNTTAEDGIQ